MLAIEMTMCHAGEYVPESNEMLTVDHGNGTTDRTTVDQEVEVDVDTCSSGSRIDNLLLSTLCDTDVRLLVFILLSNKWRDVRLETTGSDTHDHETNTEDGDRDVGLDDDCRDSRHDEDDMADEGNEISPLDSGVTPPVLISKPGTTERSDVRPELVEHGQTSGSTLAHTERARSGLFEETGTSLGAWWESLLDKVDD